MSPIQAFLTARAAKTGKQPVANDAQPVTRAEFNTLTLAVNALLEDVEALTSPERLGAVLNQAITEATKGIKLATNARASRASLAPRGDDELGNIMPPRNPNLATVRNAQAPGRKPLALGPDRAFLAPAGD